MTFIGEFPSCTAHNKEKESENIYDRFVKHLSCNADDMESITLSRLQDSFINFKRWLQTMYNLLRTVASEILVFMLSDLDRIYDMECNNAHPVAYALKGPSMSTDIFSKMMEKVISEYEKNKLNVLVTASDGQWHLCGIRDKAGNPLTVHQLHKDNWKNMKTFSELKTALGVDCLSKLQVEIQEGSLTISLCEAKEIKYYNANWSERKDTTDKEDTSLTKKLPITTSAFDGEMDTELDDDLLDQVDEVFNDTNDDINIKQSSNDNALELNSLFYPDDSLYFQNTNQNFSQSYSTGTNYLEILERHSCFAEDTYTYNHHNLSLIHI